MPSARSLLTLGIGTTLLGLGILDYGWRRRRGTRNHGV